ncbi:MAG: serine hydrolase [Prevotellaceae bacterium]|jgi:beta-glucosidase-like glycosyl hydrolase/CubicO group peptidase (beta-lactamase class C family)|nr:serine hydrolase [Prevotellaceae bacterium]
MLKRFLLCAIFAAVLPAELLAHKRESLIETLSSPDKWADSVLATLNTREKIAQLMMVAAYSNKGSAHVDEVASLVLNHKVGGLIFFQGTASRQAELTTYYQSLAQVPLLIGMDAEWGVGMRLDSVASLPFQLGMGAARNEELTYRAGVEVAKQFQLLGMHVNFAPVADVNSNPENPVINVRSFGQDQHAVADGCVAYAKGLQDNGIIACAKHFPGHGNTDKDSHSETPLLSMSRQSLEKVDLYPFKKLIESDLGGIMVGHLSVPKIDASGQMASLSPKLSGELLRKKMKFRGLVFSDGMQMKAVMQQSASPAEANLQALLAGMDMLVFPVDVPPSIDAIEAAVNSGKFLPELLDEKCLRVLKAKRWAGLSDTARQRISSANITKRLSSPDFIQLRNQLIEDGITLVGNRHGTLPIGATDTLRIAYVELSKGNRSNTFYRTASNYAQLRMFRVDQARPSTYDSLEYKLAPYNLVIVGYMDISQRMPQRNFGLDSIFCRKLVQLAQSKRTVLALFANPYVMPKIGDHAAFESVLLAYGNSEDYQRAAAQAIFGATPIVGRSPVSVGGFVKLGEGLECKQQLRLRYGLPEDLHIRRERLAAIDSMVKQAIDVHAFPGCQVLAASHGTVFYNKTFGYHTYENKRRVRLTDIYDVASLTKVSATLPLIMELVDKKKIRLTDTLGDYLALDSGCNKSGLQLRDILLHQSGLKAWIPVHVAFMHSTFPDQPLLAAEQSEVHPFRVYARTYLNKYHALDSALFADSLSADYPYTVADGIYAHADIRRQAYCLMDESELLNKSYRYSDLGFYYLQRVAETLTSTSLDSLAEAHFYSPLGMFNTTFLPRQKFSPDRIVPTEWEHPFRHQLIHGYVHDHGAAIVGGVAGHAGLFSTAGDLAKLFQMFLWRGQYGGVQLLSPQTVDEFTRRHSVANRRGLGFDKPEPSSPKLSPVCREASPQSYGHSGFTGTFVWVDPQRELVFIFLSNRVHPDSNNTQITTTSIRSNILRELILALDEAKQ